MHLLLALAAVASATTVDVGPLLNDLLQLAATALIALVGWGVTIATTRLHIANTSAMATAVTGALDNGISFAAHQAQVKLEGGLPIDVKNALAAEAAAYVIAHYKDWLATLGLSEQALVQTALAKLPH